MICFIFLRPSSADIAFNEDPCKGSFYEDYCKVTIGKDLEFLACDFDQLCMAKVAINRAIQNSLASQRKIEELLHKTNPAPRADWVKPLKTCVDIYGSITHFLNGLIRELNSSGKKTIRFYPDQEKCSAAFPGRIDASSMRDLDRSLGINLRIALEFYDLIEN